MNPQLRLTMRHAALLGFLLLAATGFAPPVAAAAPPPEHRKLHALLVIDTRSGLGQSVEIDGHHVQHVLETGVPKERLEITVLKEGDVTAERILGYYRNLKLDPTDIVLFYYAGHGAIDPKKGQFMQLQALHTTPLLRADLLRTITDKKPALTVVLTDCCSSRCKFPNASPKKHRGVPAKEISPVLRSLLFQPIGVVDITATGDDTSAFGDDEDGGLFTRSLCKLLMKPIESLSPRRDDRLDWDEFFPRLQQETENCFSNFATTARSHGEKIDQKSQKPRALELPHAVETTATSLTLQNKDPQPVNYQYRWSGAREWENGTLPARGSKVHTLPSSQSPKDVPGLEVKFENGETGLLKFGKTYRFSNDKKTP